MREQKQWLSKEEQDKQNAAERSYFQGVRDARVWLESLEGSGHEALRDALEGRMARVLSQVGPESLGWRDTLSKALEKLRDSEVKRGKLKSTLLQYEMSREGRLAAEQRRLSQVEAAERAFRANLAAIDSAIASMSRVLEATEQHIPLYDLRGVSKLSPNKRIEVARSQEEAEQAERAAWESYDRNPYEPHDSPEEDPYYEERLLAALPLPE